jgi:hypothetical protein
MFIKSRDRNDEFRRYAGNPKFVHPFRTAVKDVVSHQLEAATPMHEHLGGGIPDDLPHKMPRLVQPLGFAVYVIVSVDVLP